VHKAQTGPVAFARPLRQPGGGVAASPIAGARQAVHTSAPMTPDKPRRPDETDVPVHAPMGMLEFVVMAAGLMALNALAMDIMLPALPAIGSALGVVAENDRQLVLTAYLIGFGAGQFLVGPVSDRTGRRQVLLSGLAVYVGCALLCAAAPTFTLLLAARFVQGLASAVPRVITTSIVRDCYGGRRMASVMSLTMTVFMAVPVLAPSIGQLVVLFASWRMIFGLLAIYGVLMAAWVSLRLPETLTKEKRRSLSWESLVDAFGQVLTTPQTVGYATAAGLMFGAMFGFLVSSQQIFTEIFGLGPYFPLAFASVALSMSLSSFINSRLVGRYGMRIMGQGAILVFVTLAAIMAVLARLDLLHFIPFMLLLGGCMFLIGMIFSNLNALAMDPQGHIAGTASSFIGSLTTLIAAVIGSLVGQAYDGTLIPFTTGYLALSFGALLTIVLTEKGRLFRR
jgi:DHA1 family bicyclomycin/chloramphenicol resistance-like MFS transporter